MFLFCKVVFNLLRYLGEEECLIMEIIFYFVGRVVYYRLDVFRFFELKSWVCVLLSGSGIYVVLFG